MKLFSKLSQKAQAFVANQARVIADLSKTKTIDFNYEEYPLIPPEVKSVIDEASTLMGRMEEINGYLKAYMEDKTANLPPFMFDRNLLNYYQYKERVRKGKK